MTEQFPIDPALQGALAERFDPDVAEVAHLTARLCAVPGVTVPAHAADLEAVAATFDLARDWATDNGLHATLLPATAQEPYPFLMVGMQPLGELDEVIALIGHLDVVPPSEPDQFRPRLEGDDLVARGAADMKAVVATWLVWMAREQARSGPHPPWLLMLSGCEENASQYPNHLGTALSWLSAKHGINVRFAVVGERTGELEWMKPEPRVGPICKENRAWRWLRGENSSLFGLAGLRTVAAAVELGRTTVHDLNERCVPEAKSQAQPGVRSGFVSSFVHVASDRSISGSVLIVERLAGAAIHAAAATTAQPALVERFAALAERAVTELGSDRVGLVGVRIGQDGNFNTVDGSGRIELAVRDATEAELSAWAAKAVPDLAWQTAPSPQDPVATTCVGLDVRELLDHSAAVSAVLDDVRQSLGGMSGFNDRPAWRCPADHPDLVALEHAYQQVIGAPSPDLVKLHGNDGGMLVELQHDNDKALAAADLGYAVVFGQVGRSPHGKGEFHRLSSVRPYWDILDTWARSSR